MGEDALSFKERKLCKESYPAMEDDGTMVGISASLAKYEI